MTALDIEGVLAAHVFIRGHLTIGGWVKHQCTCGHKYDNPNASEFASHPAHVAAVLREQIAEAQAEAWERCSREFALNALNSATHEAAMRSLRDNPYRAAQVAPSRVPSTSEGE